MTSRLSVLLDLLPVGAHVCKTARGWSIGVLRDGEFRVLAGFSWEGRPDHADEDALLGLIQRYIQGRAPETEDR